MLHVFCVYECENLRTTSRIKQKKKLKEIKKNGRERGIMIYESREGKNTRKLTKSIPPSGMSFLFPLSWCNGEATRGTNFCSDSLPSSRPRERVIYMYAIMNSRLAYFVDALYTVEIYPYLRATKYEFGSARLHIDKIPQLTVERRTRD